MLIFAFIFVCRQDRSHQPTPYPLNFREPCTAIARYPRFFHTSIPNRFREWHSRDVPFRHLVPELSRSTKLQSSSESVIIFASYKFAVYDLSAIRQRTACLHTSSTCCQKPEQPHRIEAFAKIMIFHQFLCKNRENHFNSKQKLSQEAVSDHFRQGGFSENRPYIAEPEPDMAA